jgi:hypothetical protein
MMQNSSFEIKVHNEEQAYFFPVLVRPTSTTLSTRLAIIEINIFL